MGDEKFSRRLFVKKFSAGVGIGAAGISGFSSLSSGSVKPVERDKRLPREVWIASISLRGLHPEDYIEARIRKMLNRMESVVPFQPDIVCLTELFPVSWVKERKPREEIAEEVPGSIVKRMGEFAKKYDCYIVCPIYTKKDGHIFNSAVLIDRKGDVAGIYHKAHTDTQYGKTKGVPTPGPLRQPVIEKYVCRHA